LYTNHDPVLLENVAQILIDMVEALEHMHENGFMHLISSRKMCWSLATPACAWWILTSPSRSQKNPRKSRRKTRDPGLHGPGTTARRTHFHRVDIFAYGVAAYELLTNQNLFPATRPGKSSETARSLRLRPAAPVQRRPAGHPRKGDPALPRREPERRYPFIGVMARELKAALYV
jgi:serine/threonine protein kinase